MKTKPANTTHSSRNSTMCSCRMAADGTGSRMGARAAGYSRRLEGNVRAAGCAGLLLGAANPHGRGRAEPRM